MMRTFNEIEDEFYREVRDELLRGLETRPETQQLLFKRMYAHEHLEWTIEETVANIARDDLSWAMSQVRRAIEKENDDANR